MSGGMHTGYRGCPLIETDWNPVQCVWCEKDGDEADEGWALLPRIYENGRLKVGGEWCPHCAHVNNPEQEYEEYVEDQRLLAEWLGG